jgi:hypothetical protein
VARGVILNAGHIGNPSHALGHTCTPHVVSLLFGFK